MKENKKVISFNQKNFSISELQKVIPSDYLLAFFAPVEWMEEIGESVAQVYKNSIGASSYKDINKTGIDYNSVSFIGIKFDDVQLLLLENIDKKMITYYKEIANLQKIYRPKHSVLLEFTDALNMAEETVLTVLNNELKNVPIIGGSAADDGKFKKTLVCINGKCKENATALCMLTTPMEIELYCENIYRPTDVKAAITDCDWFNRQIHKINDSSATEFYCKTLNISTENMRSQFISHPIAKIMGDNYFITSVKNIDGNSFNTCARNFNHSCISICNPIDYRELWNKRRQEIKNKYLGGIFINCTYRTMLFEQDNTVDDFIKYLTDYGEFSCMSSYGEQFCYGNANQTMTACLFKEC